MVSVENKRQPITHEEKNAAVMKGDPMRIAEYYRQEGYWPDGTFGDPNKNWDTFYKDMATCWASRVTTLEQLLKSSGGFVFNQRLAQARQTAEFFAKMLNESDRHST